eukprot:gnl/Chilomastix_cuspidata/357.p3 GENE.gnl/Chilomastix_cuspidata/357~~gnl/Chilomastix_cuspidata/357.p3  ORF type:complete len:155 (-),score=64.79 gnl/Chilomastix_cuspidata/357:311-775(-)
MARTKNVTGPRAVSGKKPRSTATKQPRKTPIRGPRRRAGVARKTATPAGDISHKRRYKPGQKALKEIKTLQLSGKTLMRKAPFIRLVREIASDVSPDMRFRAEALDALMEGAESYLVSLLGDTNLAAIHANRVTIMKRDMNLVLRIRREKFRMQ